MQIIIVGGGKTGTYLAPILKDDGSSVTIIENRKTAVEKFRAALPDLDIICGNGTSPEILEKAGILNADVVIAATGSDEVNLVVSTLSKVEYQVPRVVARVNNPKNAWMFNESMGVDVGINQADLLARSVQEGLDMEDVFTIMRLGKDNHALVQIEIRQHPCHCEREGSRRASPRLRLGGSCHQDTFCGLMPSRMPRSRYPGRLALKRLRCKEAGWTCCVKVCTSLV